jgi:hypothetical protein
LRGLEMKKYRTPTQKWFVVGFKALGKVGDILRE